MDDEDYQVSSEIYDEYDYGSESKPTFNPKHVVSRFEFTCPKWGVLKDSDGDLIVPRKGPRDNKLTVEIEHSKSTVLGLVGLQVWRGALLLADWLIHHHDTIPKDSYVLELGSGVGLTSIIASMNTKVYCTDVDKGDILGLIRSNIERNKHLVKNPIEVFELDFTSDKLPTELEANIEELSTIIAADTVYDDHITEAFVKTLERILSVRPSVVAYVALERRYVFTLAECDSCAPCYDYFIECLRGSSYLLYEEVPLDFPLYFSYERAKELVLWRIVATSRR